MKTKELYNAPEMEMLELGIETNVLTGSQDGLWDNSIKEGTTWGDGSTDYGME